MSKKTASQTTDRRAFGDYYATQDGKRDLQRHQWVNYDRWLRPAAAGLPCDNCDTDVDVICLNTSAGVVNLCCKCLEEAASYAQP